MVAAAPGRVNAQQAMILPPLSVDRAVFQPDQARAAGEYRPVLVDEQAAPVDRPAAPPPAPIAALNLDARRAAARPKAPAPPLPEHFANPNALSIGAVTVQERMGGNLDFPVVIIPPPSREETEAIAAVDFEQQGFSTLREWIDRNPNHPGLQASARRLQSHQDRIVELQAQIEQFRTARREAGWGRARVNDRGLHVQQPAQPPTQEVDPRERRPLIEEIDLNSLGL